MDRGQSTEKEKHPRETTNIISRLSFFYLIQLFKKGYTKGLEFEDIYEVLSTCRSKVVGEHLENQWRVEKAKQKNPSLCRCLVLCFGRTFVTLGVIQLTVRLIMTICLPLAQSKLISYFNPGQKELSKDDAIYFGCIVIGLKVFNLFFFHNFLLYVLALGLRVKAAVSTLIYKKSLLLNCEALSQVTVGKITTIVNRDVEIFQQFISQGNEIWIALVQTGVICYLIYQKIGLASWAGVTFFFFILPLQMFLGKLAFNYRLQCSKKTDERLEITQEVLSAIKIIKIYTWERYFEKKISNARKTELEKLYKLFYSRVWISVIGSVCSKMAFFIFLMTYVWMDNRPTAETVYYILSCFGDLQSSLSNSIPFGISKAAEVYAVIKRCEDILNCQETLPKVQTTQIICPHIHFAGAFIKVNGKIIISNLNLDINKGLNIIIGHVGSGKSALLKSIMQECEVTGDVRVTGSISYAPEEPWLFPSTIKNNILFGEKYSEKRYRKILQICSLDYDFDSIDQGDDTTIGDRGLNLSKGQQARISLARALYKNSDIYLLDDCLASLDGHVSDHIFKECVQKFLKNKICLFVTNNLDYVQEADQIITLNHGCVSCTKNSKQSCFIDSRKYEIDENINVEEISKRVTTYYEFKKPGKVSLADYYQYVSYGGGILVFCLVIGLFTAHQSVNSYSEKLLSTWVTLEQNVTNLKLDNQTQTVTYQQLSEETSYGLMMYCIMFAVTALLYLTSTFAFFFCIKTASTNLHKEMLKSVINTTLKFFDTNYVGNILTRFSKDCVTADEYLPFTLIECLRMVFIVVGGIILLTSVNVIFLIECLFLLIIAYMIKRFCQPTGRNLQRLHVIARCPMIGHVNSSLTGLSVIRSSNAEQLITHEFDRYQDQFTSTHYMLDNSLIALSFYLDLFNSLLIASIIVQFLTVGSGASIGDVGLAINQAFTISDIIANGIRIVSDCENLMTSVERILEYVRLEQEDKTGSFLDEWPKSGSIIYSNVSLKYGLSARQMLKRITFTVPPKAKIGIVGRTGAGKSSVVSSLLRLYETEGKISIDDVDIKDITLVCLRSKISVISQDPFLFSGTIRENLDPLNQYTDAAIWKVLADVQLKTTIDDLSLEVDKGLTLSVGQQQLLCLARVILRRSKIIILDEATANVDQETDNVIHRVVFNNFAECTVLVIAHRLSSVLTCDKILVLKNGEISEYDEPANLLKDKNNFFNYIVK